MFPENDDDHHQDNKSIDRKIKVLIHLFDLIFILIYLDNRLFKFISKFY